MLAEAVHSVADTSNQALLLWGGSAARRRPSEMHPFGYGQERYFWSFVVALVIFSVGGLFALFEGVEKLRHPHEVANVSWAVGILLVAIVLELFSFRTAVVASRPLKGRSSWMTFVRTSKNPELPVVLLEDLGALLGLVIALAGVALAAWTGDPRWDAAGSVAIGALLVVIAVTLAVEMKSLLIGESASPEHLAAIRETLAAAQDIERIIHMRTLPVGPDHLSRPPSTRPKARSVRAYRSPARSSSSPTSTRTAPAASRSSSASSPRRRRPSSRPGSGPWPRPWRCASWDRAAPSGPACPGARSARDPAPSPAP
jgi:cation diffusion facilitator family transporter